jgi:hypothetical protein
MNFYCIRTNLLVLSACYQHFHFQSETLRRMGRSFFFIKKLEADWQAGQKLKFPYQPQQAIADDQCNTVTFVRLYPSRVHRPSLSGGPAGCGTVGCLYQRRKFSFTPFTSEHSRIWAQRIIILV